MVESGFILLLTDKTEIRKYHDSTKLSATEDAQSISSWSLHDCVGKLCECLFSDSRISKFETFDAPRWVKVPSNEKSLFPSFFDDVSVMLPLCHLYHHIIIHRNNNC